MPNASAAHFEIMHTILNKDGERTPDKREKETNNNNNNNNKNERKTTRETL